MSSRRRRLRILELLTFPCEGKQWRLESLAQETGESRETIFHDLRRLSLSHVPIYFDGTYRILPELPISPLRLSFQEVLLLAEIVEAPSRARGKKRTAPYKSSYENLVKKLKSAFPVSFETLWDSGPKEVSQQLLASMDGPFSQESYERLETGISSHKTVKLLTTGESTSQLVWKTCHPLLLVFHRGETSLVAYVPQLDRIRTIKGKAVCDTLETEDLFTPPVEFNYRSALHDIWGFPKPERERVRLLVTRRGFSTYGREMAAEVQPKEEGASILTLTVNHWQELLPWVLAFGDEAEVLEPQPLRNEMRRIAKGFFEKYWW
ncbi:MAG: WYL domain-containing protein [Armatimonadetes bacterium]|nr:WYL domain-containing protein [Armatimonadota bacterium]